MTDDPVFTGTYAANPTEPPVTFEEMTQLVREMTKGPMLKEIRCDHTVLAALRFWAAEDAWERQKRFGPEPPQPVNVYASGTPIRIDKTFKRGQWQAIDTEGNVMQEGNVFG